MPTILVVDDDPDVVDACRMVLEAEGHEVLAAHNKSDGKTQIKNNQPDLVVLDVMMDEPDDGISLAQEIRRDGCQVPILMLTSVGKVTGLDIDKDDTVVPVDAFYEKPIDPQTLVKSVGDLLSKKGVK